MAMQDSNRAFLGVGWAYPARLDAQHRTARVAYEEDVRQAVLIILGTNPGERVMRPTFGAGLNAFLFAPITTTTLTRLQNRVLDALVEFEPRIHVEHVHAAYERSQQTRVNIEILYLVRATNNQFNLVYPFYLQEGTAV